MLGFDETSISFGCILIRQQLTKEHCSCWFSGSWRRRKIKWKREDLLRYTFERETKISFIAKCEAVSTSQCENSVGDTIALAIIGEYMSTREVFYTTKELNFYLILF